ncbi:MAG TPA: hypothetical protein VIJ14_05220, partial [Rhabdochlamydiaceae bacterium]
MAKLKSIFIFGLLFISQLTASGVSTPFMTKTVLTSYKDYYAKEREILSQEEINDLLDRGLKLESQTALTKTLSEGGSALFPHTNIRSCGDQTAAVAHACLAACQKTGKNQILLIGVLHSLTDPLRKGLYKEIENGDLSDEPCRGTFGPGLPFEEIYSEEFSLGNFIFLLDQATKRAGIESPKVIIRYANLSQGHPETLPRIEEITKIARDSIVVATADLCHHGVSYRVPPEDALAISPKAIDFAKERIETGLKLLSKCSYLEYRDYALKSRSDSKE